MEPGLQRAPFPKGRGQAVPGYRIEIPPAVNAQLAKLETELRQEVLLKLGALTELAEEMGLGGFGPRAQMWTDVAKLRILYEVDERKRVLRLVDLQPR